MVSEWRTLIVDDEGKARQELRKLLKAHPQVSVLGEAESVAEAAKLAAQLQPNLIFLDIQMPGGDGFHLLPRLQPLPAIIFVTAYGSYAVRAFEVNAVDYLMKPIQPDRLANAIERLSQPGKEGKIGPFLRSDQILLRSGSSMRRVFAKHINCIKALGNYSEVHIADVGIMTVRQKMSGWKKTLPASLFLTLDRSLMINRESLIQVAKISPMRFSVGFAGGQSPIKLGYVASTRLRLALHL